MKVFTIILIGCSILLAAFGFGVFPGPQNLGYKPVVEPPGFLSDVPTFRSWLAGQGGLEVDVPSSVEISVTEEPVSEIYIATISVPTSAFVNEQFSVSWDCSGASLAKIGQMGEEILEASGTKSFTVSVAGLVDFTVNCTWPDGKVVSQTGTVQMVSVEVTNSTCSLTDGTAQIKVEQIGSEYVVDPSNLKVVDGYNNTQPGHDVSELSGCDMWSEYEGDRVHVIDVLRDDPSKELSYLGDDGKYHFPSPMGGSFWVGPSDWNTADFSTEKPSIALEMAAAKDINQQRNGYDWPEVIRLPDLTFRTYEVGHEYGGFYSGCVDLETSPAPVNVAGTIVEGGYNASIGIEGCLIAVKLDGEWTYWSDARDNVIYSTSASAYLFKKGTTKEEVQEWIDSQ